MTTAIPTAQQPLLKPEEASKLLAISPRTLWTLTASGQVCSVKIGRLVRYRPEDLQAFIAAQQKEARA
jgi:excisionase family DNA binding protein